MTKKQVKTKKVKKKKLNLKRTFVLIMVILLVIMGFKQLLKINVKNIIIEGNDYLSDSVIIKAAELRDDTSFISFSTKDVCEKITALSLVDTCSITRNLGFKITITITENKPLFYYSYKNLLALSNGEMIDENNTYGVPTLINYVPEDVLTGFIEGLGSVDSDIIRSISEIEYTPTTNSNGTYIDKERFMLAMNDGNIVYVNNNHLSVLNSYDKIYASIGDKKGIYNLDCDFGNYYFEEFSVDEEG